MFFLRSNDNPLAVRSILSFVLYNVGILFLLSLAADIIQILTFDTYGWIIFKIIIGISSVVYILRVVLYFHNRLRNLEIAVGSLKNTLAKISVEISVRSSLNSNPSGVNAWVSTRKFGKSNLALVINSITSTSVIVSQGGKHGLVNYMTFNLRDHNDKKVVDQCVVEAVYDNYATLSHSGDHLTGKEDCKNYYLELVDPSISDSELILGKLLLMIQDLDN